MKSTELTAKEESLELTAEDERIVLEHREFKKQAAEHERRILYLLETASKFKRWLMESGSGVSFSTFCNDFEVETLDGYPDPKLYEDVLDILSKARGLT